MAIARRDSACDRMAVADSNVSVFAKIFGLAAIISPHGATSRIQTLCEGTWAAGMVASKADGVRLGVRTAKKITTVRFETKSGKAVSFRAIKTSVRRRRK